MAKNLSEQKRQRFDELARLKEAVVAAETALIEFDEKSCNHELLFYLGCKSLRRLSGNAQVTSAYCWSCGKFFSYDVPQGQTPFEVFHEKHPNLLGIVKFKEMGFDSFSRDCKMAYINDVCESFISTSGITTLEDLIGVLSPHVDIY